MPNETHTRVVSRTVTQRVSLLHLMVLKIYTAYADELYLAESIPELRGQLKDIVLMLV